MQPYNTMQLLYVLPMGFAYVAAYLTCAALHILNLAQFIVLGSSLQKFALAIQHTSIACLVLKLEPNVLHSMYEMISSA